VLDISRLRPRPPRVPRSRVVITSAAQEQATSRARQRTSDG
jgi:hypothetical protein